MSGADIGVVCAAAELYDFDDEKVKAILSCFVHQPI